MEIQEEEQRYLDLLSEIVRTGSRQKNRTGIDSFMIPGAALQFDLQRAFPAITTKRLAFNAVKGELIGFLRGYTSAADFRKLGCKIWDQNANENKAWLANPFRIGEDDLGYIYSKLWTDMPTPYQDITKGRFDSTHFGKWNQITKLIEAIKKDPTSRRLIVSAWHPEVFDQAALPPCHALFQVLIDQERGLMHMTMYQRSCDMFLGVPFNIASYSLLLELIARYTGYKAGKFTWFGADCHIYENHLDQVNEQIRRDPYPFPTIKINDEKLKSLSYIGDIEPDDIELVDYVCHSAIKAPMAV